MGWNHDLKIASKVILLHILVFSPKVKTSNYQLINFAEKQDL
jgi:hypothetical protein